MRATEKDLQLANLAIGFAGGLQLTYACAWSIFDTGEVLLWEGITTICGIFQHRHGVPELFQEMLWEKIDFEIFHANMDSKPISFHVRTRAVRSEGQNACSKFHLSPLVHTLGFTPVCAKGLTLYGSECLKQANFYFYCFLALTLGRKGGIRKGLKMSPVSFEEGRKV